MRTKAAVSFLVIAAVALGLASTGTAVTTDSEVAVHVATTTSVDLSPDTLNYSGVQPGNFTFLTQRGYDGVEVENTGSTNITEIYFRSSMPDERPFGTGSATEYDAGNFIMVRPASNVDGIINPDASGEQGHFFVTRRDYNVSNELSYVDVPSSGVWRYGRFRVPSSDGGTVDSEQFFWAMEMDGTNSDDNRCDGEGSAELRVGEDPHTNNQLGSVDFTDSSEYTAYTGVTDAGDFGRIDDVKIKTDDGPRNMTVMTYCGDGSTNGNNKTFMTRTRYNVNPEDINPDSQDPTLGSELSEKIGSLERFLNSSNNDVLEPGSHFTVKTALGLPRGVAEGDVTNGTLRLVVGTS